MADIIAGRSADGTHKGVAPGASLYAVKVCASFSSSCSGIAILQGLDWAADPNGDGNVDDMVDIVNMSLGASYGQKQNRLVEASANLVGAGVVVVVSAGNSGDKPYVLGSPASTLEVIAVAQTQVPSAFVIPLTINSPASIAGRYTNTATIEWAPITGNGFRGDVAFVGRGCPAGSPAPVPEGGDRSSCFEKTRPSIGVTRSSGNTPSVSESDSTCSGLPRPVTVTELSSHRPTSSKT